MFRAQNDVLYSDDCKVSGSDSSSSPSGSGAGSDCEGKPLPESVPKYWRDLIDNAAKDHPDVDRRTVAAELWVENRGWPDPNKSWATSPAGAGGPWQFMPASWASMGQDGDGDGVADRNNPKDAVHGAFNHNKGTACKPILEGATGDAQSDYENVAFTRDGTNTLMSSIANYNGRGAPNGVPIGKSPTGDENSDYTKMAYWLIASDFKQSIDPKTGQMVDATTAGSPEAANGEAGGASTSANGESSGADCKASDKAGEGTGAPVEIDGNKYAFPVVLPKGDVTNGTSWPCPGTCHHDGTAAFDLSRNAQDDSSENVPVVAITDGTIERFNNSYAGVSGCQAFQLKGNDGYYYWYGHVQSSSVQDGSTVSVGQQISVIGRRACTGNGSYPHLHIDRGAKGTMGGSMGNRDRGIVQLINQLYEKL